MKTELTQQRLRELLSYEPESGEFFWIKPAQGRRRDRPAGGKTHEGYVSIGVERRVFQAHRLAWLYVHGEWPEHEIDHINGQKSDNRIANLRDIPHSVNNQNQRRPQAHNTSGYLGVCEDTSRRPGVKRFRAMISSGGLPVRIGWYYTPEAAHEAYLQTKRRLHAGCTI